MALSVPEKIAQAAEHFAKHDAHGYSQYERGTGSSEQITFTDGTKATISGHDIDCSEMVRQCVNVALSGSYKRPIEYMWTGNEDEELTAQGFNRMAFDRFKVRRGDILWRSGHTGVAVSATKQSEAVMDENGGLGGRSGDQTGQEVAVNPLSYNWSRIYRYYGDAYDTAWFEAPQTHEFAKASYVRTEPATGQSTIVKSGGKSVRYSAGESVTIDGLVISEGYVWGTYVGGSGARRYVVVGNAGRLAKRCARR